jgi:glycosyltransferase involved in cell wall biosynthesis
VIPQRKNFASVGQVPAKVFDAMAMAKPIIATNVSDLPEILDGCGWIVEPENPEQLAETIQYVLNNSQEADIIGQKARQKCIEKYSWDVMDKILMRVFGKYKGI